MKARGVYTTFASELKINYMNFACSLPNKNNILANGSPRVGVLSFEVGAASRVDCGAVPCLTV